MTAVIRVKNITKSYQVHQILKNISLEIAKGEIIAVLGKSGCGKSTLLKIIGGFEQQTTGDITVNDTPVTMPTKHCIMLMQSYGLLPWRSVAKNISLPLEQQKNLSDIQLQQRVAHYMELVQLTPYATHHPHQLSGGMQQRVAIARALAMQPQVILLDEPFAALDTFTRYFLQDELLKIQQQEKTTMMLVTHDIDEAIYLADRIIILAEGQIAKEIKVALPKPRDRSNADFQYYREVIFSAFEFSQPQIVDYQI